ILRDTGACRRGGRPAQGHRQDAQDRGARSAPPGGNQMRRAGANHAGEPIAVIGMSGRFPPAKNLEEVGANLRDAKECIAFFSKEDLEHAGLDPAVLEQPDYVNAGGVMADADLFDAAFFGINAREAESLDPQQRVFMECAWHALEDAGYA